jgi:hypothetical protein
LVWDAERLQIVVAAALRLFSLLRPLESIELA